MLRRGNAFALVAIAVGATNSNEKECDIAVRHKNGTATFEQLDYHDQARSISQAIVNLERMIQSTLRKAAREGRNVQRVHNVKKGQVQRLLNRL